jgi:hypothetical protein
LLIGIIISFIPVSATNRTVINLNDSGAGSLRQAIYDAIPGDKIIFATNLSGETISLTSGQLVIDKDLTIDGSTLANPITISGDNLSRVFSVGNESVVTLDSLTISDGYATSSSSDGGGIELTSGILTVMNCRIVNNYAEGDGGGIFTLWDQELMSLVVKNCTFSGNISPNNGGAIMNYGLLDIQNSTFSSNSSGYGAGIYSDAGTITITNSTFSGNSSSINGGGIYNGGDTILNITNSTFAENDASNEYTAGGIYNDNATMNYVNTIIANSISGLDCINNGFIGTNSNNLVESEDDCNAGLSIDPLLDILDDYGGSTQTHALLLGSPAIDTGNPAVCPATDQRGVLRPQGEGCDIGAYEYGIFIYLPLIIQ